MASRVFVMVGTRKGGLVFSSDAARRRWRSSDLLFKSWNVMHMTLDERDGRMHAAVAHDVYGPSTHYSDDLGATWKQAEVPPAFSRASKSGRPPSNPMEAMESELISAKPEKVNKVWNIKPGRPTEPNILYAGIEPAALFISTDRGVTWQLNEAIFDHPHRPTWFPGAGGLCLHSIAFDPNNTNKIYIAISAAGVYRSDDGGITWLPRNRNTRADFFGENNFPEYGQCVHRLALHPARPNVLFQQNHCGVYRSDDYGDSWIDIGEDRLPSRFGFPILIHPHEPETVYVALEESDAYRLSVGGQFAVWRSRDSGETWTRLTQGLPDHAHLVVLRHGMAADTLEEAGIYVGTSTGQLFYSRNSGDTWELLADYLPPILSIEAAVVDS